MTYKSKLLSMVLAALALVIFLPLYVDITWHAWLLIPLLCYLTKGIGSEIGAHRLWAHRSFKTTKFYSRLMIVLQTLAGEGSIIAFAGVHRLHHRYSDSDQDPHNPKNNLWGTVFYQHKVTEFSPLLIKDLLVEKWLIIQHKYYFTIQAILVILLTLISPLCLWYYAVNVISTLWINFLVNVVCHWWGDNANELDNNSKNTAWTNIFLLGVGLHNNHHKEPGAYDLAWKSNQFDLWANIIKFIKK